MTTAQKEALAISKIKALSTQQLIEGFESLVGKRDMEMVRGWIMDELESRDPEAFEAWIDSDDTDDVKVLTSLYL